MNAIVPVLTATVRVADLADRREAAWIDGFVADHPEGTIFHRPQWGRAVELGCGARSHYLIAEKSGHIAGCLPLSEVRSRLFGNALVSAGFATGGGILAHDEAVAAALAAAAWSLAQARGCSSAELRGGPIPHDWAALEGSYTNFDRDLPGDAAALLASIPRRQRAEIRRALASPLETTAGRGARDRQAHFQVYAESVRNLGTPVFPRRLYEAALDEFGEDADIVTVWIEGRPLASMLSFYFKDVCQPYWGGGTASARRTRANDLIYFEVMRRGLERGCIRADFGRSKLGTGPWKRKKIWGFRDTPLIYGVRTASGGRPREVNPLNPKYRLRIAAWQRLPLWLANRVGPAIARGLG